MIRVFRQYTRQSPRQFRKEQGRGASLRAPQDNVVTSHEPGKRGRA
jgi:hypothetical protein